MRLIDADALKEKKVYSHERHERIVSVAEIDWMPTIAAIPVEWLIEHDDEDIRDSDGNSYGRRKITVVEALSMWQKEQEVR